jgi:hypothetical protein
VYGLPKAAGHWVLVGKKEKQGGQQFITKNPKAIEFAITYEGEGS